MKHLITLTNGEAIQCSVYIESTRLSGFLCVGSKGFMSENAHEGQSQLINKAHILSIHEITEDEATSAKFFFV